MKIEEHNKLGKINGKLITCTDHPNSFPNLKSSNVQNRENSI